MVYETDESYYLTQIDRAYDYSSKLLLDIMFNQMKLKDHFRYVYRLLAMLPVDIID